MQAGLAWAAHHSWSKKSLGSWTLISGLRAWAGFIFFLVDLNSMIMFLPLVQSKSVVILRGCFGFCAFLILGFSPGTCFPTSFFFINLKPFPSLFPLSFFLSLLAVIFRFLGFTVSLTHLSLLFS
jgi:hypothetical protein